MKKTTVMMLAAAALGLAACSSDEPVSINQGTAIDFRPAIGRSTELTNANLTQINVTGLMGDEVLFYGTDFIKSEDGFFQSTPEYYWPADDSEMTFYAYAPSQTGATVSIGKDSKTMNDFSPAATMADQIDFITSTATGKKSTHETTGVELTFDHQLTQIEVQAKADNEAYTFEITGVRIGQPVSRGSFDFTANTWTLGSDKAIYEETYSAGKTLTPDPVSVMGEGGNAILLPQQLTPWDPEDDAANANAGAYLAVKLKVTTTETGVEVYPYPSDPGCQWAAIPIDDNWMPGHKYVYVLDLSNGAGYVDPKDPEPGKPVLGGPIKFTVDVTPWTESEIDKPMHTGN